jgi:hypothetical protein
VVRVWRVWCGVERVWCVSRVWGKCLLVTKCRQNGRSFSIFDRKGKRTVWFDGGESSGGNKGRAIIDNRYRQSNN